MIRNLFNRNVSRMCSNLKNIQQSTFMNLANIQRTASVSLNYYPNLLLKTSLHTSPPRFEEIDSELIDDDDGIELDDEDEKMKMYISRHPERDRRHTNISVETSIRYMNSKAFKEAYGDHPVWFLYRRNHKHSITKQRTRKMCIRVGVIRTGNPCPICRDEFLVVDYRNLDLLKQFISPLTGKILPTDKTGVCRKQHKNLLVAYEKAKDLGSIVTEVPFRYYDYNEYIPT